MNQQQQQRTATSSNNNNNTNFLLHFVVLTSIGDTVVYEASFPDKLQERLQLDLEFFVHASLDTLDLLCREKPDCFLPALEYADGTNRSVSAYCPIGPYRLLLVVEPQILKRDDVKSFFVNCNKILADYLRNPMATIHAKISSQSVKDSLKQQMERLQRQVVTQ